MLSFIAEFIADVAAEMRRRQAALERQAAYVKEVRHGSR